MNVRFHGKAKIVLLLGLVCILSLTVAIWAAAQGSEVAQGSAEVRADATIIVPTQISNDTGTVTVYVSGFVPDELVSVKLIGGWKMGGEYEVVDPVLGGGTANKYGAAKMSIFKFNNIVKTFGIEPGVYSLIAEQEDLAVASAPIEVTEPEK